MIRPFKTHNFNVENSAIFRADYMAHIYEACGNYSAWQVAIERYHRLTGRNWFRRVAKSTDTNYVRGELEALYTDEAAS